MLPGQTRYVREWRTRDYQAPVLKRAALVDGARKRDWKQLPAMLDYITSKGRDEVFATSLIRMVVGIRGRADRSRVAPGHERPFSPRPRSGRRRPAARADTRSGPGPGHGGRR